jgi:hypothetical protein
MRGVTVIGSLNLLAGRCLSFHVVACSGLDAMLRVGNVQRWQANTCIQQRRHLAIAATGQNSRATPSIWMGRMPLVGFERLPPPLDAPVRMHAFVIVGPPTHPVARNGPAAQVCSDKSGSHQCAEASFAAEQLCTPRDVHASECFYLVNVRAQWIHQ